jgi:hypothetical protein
MSERDTKAETADPKLAGVYKDAEVLLEVLKITDPDMASFVTGLFAGIYTRGRADGKGELERFRKENDYLRGVVANAKIPCVYCGLENMAECRYGFPGCSKADDMILGDDEVGQRLIAENTEMKKQIEEFKARGMKVPVMIWPTGEAEALRAGLEEKEAAIRYLVDVAIRVPKGHCYTLPDGSCVGTGCMHDPKPREKP